jgi:hypothetical protein
MSDKIISSIYNYCDRWCEKCRFANRCTVGLETYVNHNNPNPGLEDIAKTFEESIEMIKSILETELKKVGADPKEIEKEALKEMSKIKKSNEDARKHPLYEISFKYSIDTHKFLKSNYYNDENPIDAEKAEVYESINWYHTMIPAKAYRICNTFVYDGFEEDPIQNDKNGTAKVLDICIKKSMAAWHKLMEIQPEFEDECLSYLVVLNKILLLNKTMNPEFMKFIRPGFDEQE